MSDLANLDGYTLREVSEADKPTLEKWIDGDLKHKDVLEADYFLGNFPDGTPDPRPTCYAIEDQAGNPLLFIRLSKVARVRIQFQPARTRNQRALVATALIRGMAYLEALLAQANVEEWVFDTADMELATFAISRLGFVASPDEMRRGIEPPEAHQGQDEALAAQNGAGNRG